MNTINKNSYKIAPSWRWRTIYNLPYRFPNHFYQKESQNNDIFKFYKTTT